MTYGSNWWFNYLYMWYIIDHRNYVNGNDSIWTETTAKHMCLCYFICDWDTIIGFNIWNYYDFWIVFNIILYYAIYMYYIYI